MPRLPLLSLVAALLFATGCPPKAEETGLSEPDPLDADGDGYDSGVDCDDEDPNVHPDADERCNGADDDCDGEVDEDAVDGPTWYADTDEDGYGDPGTTTQACAAPAGYVEDATDCDDTSADIHPDAIEQCNGLDDDCDGSTDEDAPDAPTWYADADGDGYGDADTTIQACTQPSGHVADDTDCDDGVGTVHPEADELCNGVDDDCDGTVDEDGGDAPTWYADADSDGYGDPGTSEVACAAPGGFVADGSDCDDASSAIHPAAIEQCNGVDDDCDGTVDEPDAADASTWYADTDGDGYGDASSIATACAQPSGYVAGAADGVAFDCDDTESAVNPAATELCNGVDDDCDGTTDEPDAADAPTWYADTDGDGYGDAASTTPACAQPSGYVGDATDCDDAAAAVNPAATELCDGVDDDCDGTVDEPDAADAATWYADTDGDGYGDAASTTPACTQPSGFVGDATDCDDAAAAVNPAATELCDGVDDDCDGTVDEPDAADAPTWYADVDADGYGDAASTTAACAVPSGYVADATDCDDGAAGVNPAAAEVCDGVDQDCDGAVDEGVLSTFYADADADGYGDAASTTAACAVPSGYTADATDCDDTTDAVNPAATELCNGVDDDCDGITDEPDAADAVTWYDDDDLDGYGDVTTTTVSCTEPSGYSSDATDCDDSDPDVNPAASEACNGADDDCDGAIDEGVLGTGAACSAEDCAEVLADDPGALDGWYELDVGTYYCDMSTDGGGWTLVGDGITIWGTGYDHNYYNSEGFTWNEALFAYVSGSVHAHCDYPGGLTGCNNIGMQFDSESWGVALNWGSSLCGMATTSYTSATTYIGGYDWVIARTESTDTVRVGTLEGIAGCTTGDNPGSAVMDVYVRR